MIEGLEEALKIKFPPGDQLHTAETAQFLKDLCAKHNIECAPPLTNARLLDKVTSLPSPPHLYPPISRQFFNFFFNFFVLELTLCSLWENISNLNALVLLSLLDIHN